MTAVLEQCAWGLRWWLPALVGPAVSAFDSRFHGLLMSKLQVALQASHAQLRGVHVLQLSL